MGHFFIPFHKNIPYLACLLLLLNSGCGECLGIDRGVVTHPAHWDVTAVDLTYFDPEVSYNGSVLPSDYLSDNSAFYTDPDHRALAAYDPAVGGVVFWTVPDPDASSWLLYFCDPGASDLYSVSPEQCRSDTFSVERQCEDTDTSHRTCTYTLGEVDIEDPAVSYDPSNASSVIFHLSGSLRIDTTEEYIPESSSCEWVA